MGGTYLYCLIGDLEFMFVFREGEGNVIRYSAACNIFTGYRLHEDSETAVHRMDLVNVNRA